MTQKALKLVQQLKHLAGKHPQKSHAGGRGKGGGGGGNSGSKVPKTFNESNARNHIQGIYTKSKITPSAAEVDAAVQTAKRHATSDIRQMKQKPDWLNNPESVQRIIQNRRNGAESQERQYTSTRSIKDAYTRWDDGQKQAMSTKIGSAYGDRYVADWLEAYGSDYAP